MADIQRLFQQELRALSEEGQQFAASFPEAARFLDPRQIADGDPYVERLAEGLSFLTARIRETLETEDDGLTRHLLEMLVPDLEQPLPSLVVVEFEPRLFFPSETALAAGSEVRTHRLFETDTACRFALCHDVPIRSYGVSRAAAQPTDSGTTWLELELETYSELARGPWQERIPFYLHGDPATVWAVRFALLRRVGCIQVSRGDDWRDAEHLRFERLDQPGYASERSYPGPFSDARDFLCADERFRFVELVGAESEEMDVEEPLRIRVEFQGAFPRGLARAVGPGLFRCHTGIALNRFVETCQATEWDHTSTTAPVIAVDGAYREILDVVDVQGVPAGGAAKRIKYHKYSSYRTLANQAHYQILRHARNDGTVSTRIALGGFDLDKDLVNLTLSVQAECSDGAVPHDLVQPDDIALPGPGIPEEILFGCLNRPTQSFRPPTSSDPRSRLLAFAAGHFDGWLEVNRLKDALRHVLWDTAESKRSLIESIQRIDTVNDHVFIRDLAWRRMHTTVVLRDTTCTPDTWDRLGTIDAFGTILFAIVQDATPIGSRTKLTIIVEPSGVKLERE